MLHFAELLIRGGHFAAFCTFLAEVSHKDNIKLAARLSGTEGSLNSSQVNMLNWYLLQQVYSEVIKLANTVADAGNDTEDDEPAVTDNDEPLCLKLGYELKFAYGWSTLPAGTVRSAWLATFLSNKVRLTRAEFLRLLAFKLEMDPVVHSREFYYGIISSLTFTFGGVLRVQNGICSRKYVGVDRSARRDFVRVRGTEDNTCLSAQV